MSEVDLSAVRQAYRYVVAYQQRLRDALIEVDQGLTELGYAFNSWTPIHASRAPGATNNFLQSRWAWDFVPMYAFRLIWTLGGTWENEPGQVFIWLDHLADTGYAKASRREPDPLSFGDAEKSDTLLLARWLKLDKKVDDAMWRGSLTDIILRHFNKTSHELWHEAPSLEITKHSKEGLETGGLCVSLEKVSTPEAFNDAFTTLVLGHAERLAAGAP